MTHLNNSIEKIEQGAVLTEKEIEDTILEVMQGGAKQEHIENLLTLMAEREESISEITGAARAMRSMASTINAPTGTIDCCGTGGDGIGTYNVSTAVAIVCASCNVPVAKHGNRAASSKSGAADVLEALGVNLDVPHERLETALHDLNFCFLMAPHHHQAMKHVMPARRNLGFRTIFNLLGPLANPAGTKHQLIGVYDKKWLQPMAQVLDNLGTKRAWLVHGRDGLDEITVTNKTDVVILEDGHIRNLTIDPNDYGLFVENPNELLGGDADENAAALLGVLNNKQNGYLNIVLLNAAAVLTIHGTATSLENGIEITRNALQSGKALTLLNNYITFTNGNNQ